MSTGGMPKRMSIDLVTWGYARSLDVPAPEPSPNLVAPSQMRIWEGADKRSDVPESTYTRTPDQPGLVTIGYQAGRVSGRGWLYSGRPEPCRPGRGFKNAPAASGHEERTKSTDNPAGASTAVRALGPSAPAASSSGTHLASTRAATNLAPGPGVSSAGLPGASGSLALGGTTASVSGASDDPVPSNVPVTTHTAENGRELQDATTRLVSRCHNNAVQIASLQEQLEACKKDKSDLEVDVILVEVSVRAKEQERLDQVVQSHNEAIRELQSTLSDVTTVHEELQVRYDRLVRDLDSVTASIARP
ncbi:uncharacterized protein B0H18DRAFT_1198601 [Fomitopsis serialis]|uniref:uncharacterized protein n=1 Tax=Fomitopsis serialis TaxID=139415 RepID=UPI002007A3A0|nr:uncharacterized protein B0H18DRAFT_1198601 [Neoantrodia serialis]KAH9918500.1 hypothetical protein B0H18DRAFT_1198601 [Neoantrodia serialis]